MILPHRRNGFWGNDLYTKLLLPFDGADEATTTFDNSASHHTVTMTNAEIDAAQSMFGGASCLFAGGSGSYVTVANSADFMFGDGDFTIDFCVKFNELPIVGSPSADQCFISRGSGDNNTWSIAAHESSGVNSIVQIGGMGDADGNFCCTYAFSAGQWYHLAFVRSGSTCYIFINGVSQSVTVSVPFGTWGDESSDLLVSGYAAGYGFYSVNGWMDEVRISKGIARWTANFTPLSMEYR